MPRPILQVFPKNVLRHIFYRILVKFFPDILILQSRFKIGDYKTDLISFGVNFYWYSIFLYFRIPDSSMDVFSAIGAFSFIISD